MAPLFLDHPVYHIQQKSQRILTFYLGDFGKFRSKCVKPATPLATWKVIIRRKISVFAPRNSKSLDEREDSTYLNFPPSNRDDPGNYFQQKLQSLKRCKIGPTF